MDHNIASVLFLPLSMVRNSRLLFYRLLFYRLPVPGRNGHFKETTLSVIAAPLIVSVLYAYCLCLCQCSCQQMPRTRCCGGSREQTSSWRRWNKGISRENAERKSAIMKKPGRRLRMMRKRWVWGSFVHELEHNFCGISSKHGNEHCRQEGLTGHTFSRDG